MILLNLPHCNHSLVLVLHHFINLMTPPINLGTGLKLCLIFRTRSKILFFEQLDPELEPALIFFSERKLEVLHKSQELPNTGSSLKILSSASKFIQFIDHIRSSGNS
jgi:hypothetical protein